MPRKHCSAQCCLHQESNTATPTPTSIWQPMSWKRCGLGSQRTSACSTDCKSGHASAWTPCMHAAAQHRHESTPRHVYNISAVSLCQHMQLKHASCHVAIYGDRPTDNSNPDTVPQPNSFGCVQYCTIALMPTSPGCSRAHAVGADLHSGACSSATCPSPST